MECIWIQTRSSKIICYVRSVVNVYIRLVSDQKWRLSIKLKVFVLSEWSSIHVDAELHDRDGKTERVNESEQHKKIPLKMHKFSWHAFDEHNNTVALSFFFYHQKYSKSSIVLNILTHTHTQRSFVMQTTTVLYKYVFHSIHLIGKLPYVHGCGCAWMWMSVFVTVYDAYLKIHILFGMFIKNAFACLLPHQNGLCAFDVDLVDFKRTYNFYVQY